MANIAQHPVLSSLCRRDISMNRNEPSKSTATP
ncbi:AraC family transcriptional regulator, partial [Pseudomonas syringae]